MNQKILRDGEPCSHRGCLNHISHPCEGCGRIGGKGEVIYNEVNNPYHPIKVKLKNDDYMNTLLRKYGRGR